MKLQKSDHFSIQLNSSLCFDVFSIEVFSETFSPVDVFILQILLLWIIDRFIFNDVKIMFRLLVMFLFGSLKFNVPLRQLAECRISTSGSWVWFPENTVLFSAFAYLSNVFFIFLFYYLFVFILIKKKCKYWEMQIFTVSFLVMFPHF